MEPKKQLTPEEKKKANKGCLTFIAILLVCFIVYKMVSSDKTQSNITSQSVLSEVTSKDLPKEVPADVLKARIDEEYGKIQAQLKYGNNWTTIEQLTNQLFNFNQWNNYINEGKSSSVDSVKKAATKLEKLLVEFQKKEFPNLRKTYCSIAKEKLWEENVDVKHLGSPYTTIELSGGYFASNKNIKTTQETIGEVVRKLRFKKVNYRWYKGADEYTYYNLKTPPDSKLGEYY